ncbi:MAG: hypothetical protein ACYSVY_17690 [Planctomycetota bacterium]|jgi:hypothetical protein
MFTDLLTRKFNRMGARVQVGPLRPRLGRRGAFESHPLAIDVLNDRHGEYFDVQVDQKLVNLEVIDVQPKDRHLLLMARFADQPRKDKFLCGHDERHWFVAAVPDARGASNVRTSMEALKPAEVRDAQARKRVKFKDRKRRKTAAYVRQGEWFFVPAPEINPAPRLVLRNEPLRRGAGKPHMVDQLYRTGGETVYVCGRHPNGLTPDKYRKLRAQNPKARSWGWQVMKRNPGVYVRGSVRHPDHATIGLADWHRVVMNTETESRAMSNVAFLD